MVKDTLQRGLRPPELGKRQGPVLGKQSHSSGEGHEQLANASFQVQPKRLPEQEGMLQKLIK